MMVLRTPNTEQTHNTSVWDVKKTTCGLNIRNDWEVIDSEVTCTHCLKKMFKRRKFTPARRFS